MSQAHTTRKHSQFSASSSLRWHNCSGSVALSEGLPDRETEASLRGTKAHEVLEEILVNGENARFHQVEMDMIRHGKAAARFIRGLHQKHPGSELLVETRISLEFIHPEMFGTFDSAVVDYFGTLHVLDYKFGTHPVSPGRPDDPNLQMMFYGVGLAHQYQWNFETVTLWIIQPNAKGYHGPAFVTLPTQTLKDHVQVIEKAVARVEKYPDRFTEGPWCYFCKALRVCPLKKQARQDRVLDLITPLD